MNMSRILVSCAVVAAGLGVLLSAGCGKREEAPKVDPSSPEVYMKDKDFRQGLTDRRKAIQAVAAKRAPILRTMEEMVRSNGTDVAALEKIPEWRALRQEAMRLNEEYEKLRREQLAFARERITPKKQVSK